MKRLQLLPTLTALATLLILSFVVYSFRDQSLDSAAQAFRKFLFTPGLAGVAAIAAASIAAFAVTRQIKHGKAVEDRKSWWQTFDWSVDRVLPKGEGPATFDPQWGIAVLEPMSTTAAADSSQRLVCGKTVDHLVEKVRQAEVLAAKLLRLPATENDEYAETLDPLRASIESELDLQDLHQKNSAVIQSYSTANRGTPGASRVADHYLYSRQIMDQIAHVATEQNWAFFTDFWTVGYEGVFDAVLESANGKVVVEMVTTSSREATNLRVRKLWPVCRKLGYGLVVVTPSEPISLDHMEAGDAVQMISISKLAIDRVGSDTKIDRALRAEVAAKIRTAMSAATYLTERFWDEPTETETMTKTDPDL